MRLLNIRLLTGEYRYVVENDGGFVVSLPFDPLRGVALDVVSTPYVHVTRRQIKVSQGYAWDGATCAPDDRFLEASCVHDALYQLMLLGKLPRANRRMFDLNMRAVARTYGMSDTLSNIYYAGVRIGYPVLRLVRQIFH